MEKPTALRNALGSTRIAASYAEHEVLIMARVNKIIYKSIPMMQ